MKNNHEILFSREQIEKMYQLLQSNDKARFVWIRSENNLSGIGPDIMIAAVEDINTDILQEEDITDPSIW